MPRSKTTGRFEKEYDVIVDTPKQFKIDFDPESETESAYIQLGKKEFLLSNRSMWVLLARHFGYENVRDEIRDLEEEFDTFSKYFVSKMTSINKYRKLQFIIHNDECVTVATENHPVMLPNEVMNKISKYIKAKNLSFEEGTSKYLVGNIFYVTTSKLAQIGIQVHPGNILTSKAIKLSLFSTIRSCLNPLSYLNLNRGIIRGKVSISRRIVRYEKISKVYQRLDETIKAVKIEAKFLDERLEKTKKLNLTSNDAQNLIVSMCNSYGISKKLMRVVFKRFEDEEEKNVWGLAMATSYISRHSKEIKSRKPYTRQNLSNIAGALTLIDDLPDTMKKAKQYINVREELRKDLPSIF